MVHLQMSYIYTIIVPSTSLITSFAQLSFTQFCCRVEMFQLWSYIAPQQSVCCAVFALLVNRAIMLPLVCSNLLSLASVRAMVSVLTGMWVLFYLDCIHFCTCAILWCSPDVVQGVVYFCFCRSRSRPHPELPGHHHAQKSRQHYNIHLQKTHIHGLHHPLHFQPPRTTQICSSQISLQQTKLIQPGQRGVPARIKHNP